MSVTTATGVRDVPQEPDEVWRALAVLEPYCSVCDVSYVVPEATGGPGVGTTFVCAEQADEVGRIAAALDLHDEFARGGFAVSAHHGERRHQSAAGSRTRRARRRRGLGRADVSRI